MTLPPLVPAVRDPHTGQLVAGPTHATILSQTWLQGLSLGEDVRVERGFWDTERHQFLDRAAAMLRARSRGLVESRHTHLRAEWLPGHLDVPVVVLDGGSSSGSAG